MAEKKWPAAGTCLSLSEAAAYFPTDRDFARAGMDRKIRLETAQDERLGPITRANFAELLPLVDVIRWGLVPDEFAESGAVEIPEIQFPGGNWRTGIIVEFLAEPAPQATAPDDDSFQESGLVEPTGPKPVPRLSPEDLKALTPKQTEQRYQQALNYREPAAAQILREGKMPGTQGYTWEAFVTDVGLQCGLLGEEIAKVRGFTVWAMRRIVRKILNSLKD
jgi:hypothetical protein